MQRQVLDQRRRTSARASRAAGRSASTAASLSATTRCGPVAHQRVDQVVTGREMPVERARADSCALGDLVERALGAALGEHLTSGSDELVVVALGVGAQRLDAARRCRRSSAGVTDATATPPLLTGDTLRIVVRRTGVLLRSSVRHTTSSGTGTTTMTSLTAAPPAQRRATVGITLVLTRPAHARARRHRRERRTPPHPDRPRLLPRRISRGSSTPTRWPSAACCCSAVASATSSDACGSSRSAWACSRSPRCWAGSPRSRAARRSTRAPGRRRRDRRAQRPRPATTSTPDDASRNRALALFTRRVVGRRLDRTDPRWAPDRCRLVALDADDQRADRHRGASLSCAGSSTRPRAGRPIRRRRGRHRDARLGRRGLRVHQRRRTTAGLGRHDRRFVARRRPARRRSSGTERRARTRCCASACCAAAARARPGHHVARWSARSSRCSSCSCSTPARARLRAARVRRSPSCR